MYETYRDRVDFHWIYIREAHALDSPRPSRAVRIYQPTTYERRKEVAKTCSSALKLTIPLLVDSMENTVALAYDAWPDRLYLLAPGGKIAYAGQPGPWGFRVDELEAALTAAIPASKPSVP